MAETRFWSVGDPEPTDCTAVVDDEGITCIRTEDPWDEGITGYFEWVRMRINRYPGRNGMSGVISGPELGNDWAELVATYGPVREATSDEATETRIVLHTPGKEA